MLKACFPVVPIFPAFISALYEENAAEASALGHGDIRRIAEVTGLSPATISPGIKELAGKTKLANKRVRQPGGGRRKIVAQLPAVEEVANLIGATTSTTGLAVECQLDPTKYKKGRMVSASEFEQIRRVQDQLHGEWNYKIVPNMLKNN